MNRNLAAAILTASALAAVSVGVLIVEGDDGSGPVSVTCQAILSETAAKQAGLTIKAGSRYQMLQMKAERLKDGTIVLPKSPGVEIVGGADGCKVIETDKDDTEAGKIVPSPCACRAVSGTCTVTLPGGKTQDAPMGLTLGPGYPLSSFSGAGCMPKACVESAGDESWPVPPHDGGTDGCPLQ